VCKLKGWKTTTKKPVQVPPLRDVVPLHLDIFFRKQASFYGHVPRIVKVFWNTANLQFKKPDIRQLAVATEDIKKQRTLIFVDMVELLKARSHPEDKKR
jgi:hypothetical protein